MTLNSVAPLSLKDAVEYEIARAKHLAFDAVRALWRQRQLEGLSQADLAKRLEGDEGWLSRNLRGPGNWTLRTLAKFAVALDGELELRLSPLEDPSKARSNYDAYAHLAELLDESWSTTASHKKFFKKGKGQFLEPEDEPGAMNEKATFEFTSPKRKKVRLAVSRLCR